MANFYDTAIFNAANKNRSGLKLANPQAYVDLINSTITKYADKYNIQPVVIKKVILQESAFWYKTAGGSVKNVDAGLQKKYGLAPTYREYGLMQVYPHYAAEDGFNPQKIIGYDIDENIHAGVYHLRDLFNQTANILQKNGVTNWFFIFMFGIASYNAGVGGVSRALVNGGYKYTESFRQLPSTTQQYLANVHDWGIA